MSSKRARKDYPQGVISVIDNGGRTPNRYTVVYTPEFIEGRLWYTYFSMDEAPFLTTSQGIGIHGQVDFRPQAGNWGSHNSWGKIIAFEDLPEDCQRAVRQNLANLVVGYKCQGCQHTWDGAWYQVGGLGTNLIPVPRDPEKAPRRICPKCYWPNQG